MVSGRSFSVTPWAGLALLVSLLGVFAWYRLDTSRPHPTDKIAWYADLYLPWSQDSIPTAAQLQVRETLEQFLLAEIDFVETPISQVADFFSEKIHAHHPEIEIALAAELAELSEAEQPSVTLRLQKISSLEALRYATDISGGTLRIDPNGTVMIVPLGSGSERLILCKLPSNGRNFDRERLEREGIMFPEGSFAKRYPERRLLVVKNTYKQLGFIRYLLEQPQATPWERIVEFVRQKFVRPTPPPHPYPPDPFR